MTILSEIMIMTTISNEPSLAPKRRRGAQPGNANALRHGFYSKSPPAEAMPGLDEKGLGALYEDLALELLKIVHMLAWIDNIHRNGSPNVGPLHFHKPQT